MEVVGNIIGVLLGIGLGVLIINIPIRVRARKRCSECGRIVPGSE